MKPYMVFGSLMEVLAVHYCMAASKEEAIEKYRKSFTPEKLAGLRVEVYEVEPCDKEALEKCIEGYTNYFEMYKYY